MDSRAISERRPGWYNNESPDGAAARLCTAIREGVT